MYEADILENIACPFCDVGKVISAVSAVGNLTNSLSIISYEVLYTSTFNGLVFKLWVICQSVDGES